eukprot:6028633-Amphidinium_carterae.1
MYIKEHAEYNVDTASPLLPWLVRHASWLINRYAVRADGSTGYKRWKQREYHGRIAIFGEC